MSLRMEKVNSQIKREIAKIMETELRDKDLGGLITVTKVDTAADFKTSKIYVSMLGVKNNKKALKALKKASGYMRSRLAKNINYRYTPELIFIFDESTEYGYKIGDIIEELKKERLEKEKEQLDKDD